MMKIIEGLKKIKYLEQKANDIKKLVSQYCVDLDCENPTYSDQKGQIASWMQSYSDILREISRLNYRIQKTNNATIVAIELDGKVVEKSISEWILRRRKLAAMELSLYTALTDKNLQTGQMKSSSGDIFPVMIRRYYDPKEKDKKIALLSSEPYEIDGKLEIINAITDLLE